MYYFLIFIKIFIIIKKFILILDDDEFYFSTNINELKKFDSK